MTPKLSDQQASSWHPPLAMENEGLSPREREILVWVARGKTSYQIGQILGISTRTVSKHLEHIFTRFGVKSRTAAVEHYFWTIQACHSEQV